MNFTRYAIYHTPPHGALANLGAAWLGWDLVTAKPLAHPQADGLDIAQITQGPRKYGFHATMKPPFRLAESHSAAALGDALAIFCAGHTAVQLDTLAVTPLGRFIALTVQGDTGPLNSLAAQTVRVFDRFRAASTKGELASRRARTLTPAQDANLICWGYPHVMDGFRFHMTLTQRLDKPTRARALHYLTQRLPPVPYTIDALSLVGERADGMFQLIDRYPFATSVIPSDP